MFAIAEPDVAGQPASWPTSQPVIVIIISSSNNIDNDDNHNNDNDTNNNNEHNTTIIIIIVIIQLVSLPAIESTGQAGFPPGFGPPGSGWGIARTVLTPIFLLRLSLLRFVGSKFPEKSLWT